MSSQRLLNERNLIDKSLLPASFTAQQSGPVKGKVSSANDIGTVGSYFYFNQTLTTTSSNVGPLFFQIPFQTGAFVVTGQVYFSSNGNLSTIKAEISEEVDVFSDTHDRLIAGAELGLSPSTFALQLTPFLYQSIDDPLFLNVEVVFAPVVPAPPLPYTTSITAYLFLRRIA